MADGVLERFRAETVRSVHAAVALAEERGDPGIGTWHLLVGLASESEEVAALVGSAHEFTETMDRLLELVSAGTVVVDRRTTRADRVGWTPLADRAGERGGRRL